MQTTDIRRIHMPYCLQRQEDGKYVVLNRNYKPLGMTTHDWVDYNLHSVRLKGLTERVAASISFKGSSDLSAIYLYNDGCVPTDSKAHMADYLERLAKLTKLKIVLDD